MFKSYGLSNGKEETLMEAGFKLDITREAVRLIEASAMRKLRAPARKALLEEYDKEQPVKRAVARSGPLRVR
jgi:RNA polymerase primary sigma factor